MLSQKVSERMVWHERNKTIERMFEGDVSLWTGNAESEEIANRLGWLDLPTKSISLLSELDHLYAELTQEGISTAVLLGMGGSSLTPYVISNTRQRMDPTQNQRNRLFVLDSTNPLEIRAVQNVIDFHKTVFIVSTKSGMTTETLTLQDYFWEQTRLSGVDHPGSHFIAVTDPGSKLIEIASDRGYRAVFTANPDIGGRYSALSVFGLLPARLMNVDLEEFLLNAQESENLCGPCSPIYRNPGLILGSILAEANQIGRDKLTIIADPQIETFGVWAEQLVAESSGKLGKGIIPVALEPELKIGATSQDRLFIYLRVDGAKDAYLENLQEAGHPCFILPVCCFAELAKQFYIWEIAIAVACALLNVNAFDQPDVQVSKDRTRQKIDQIRKAGKLDHGEPVFIDAASLAFWKHAPDRRYSSLAAVLDDFLAQVQPGDYFAINAFIMDDGKNAASLQDLREKISTEKRIPTTSGFGPRYLHSTGQLHKGGPNNGLFLVITQETDQKIDIPAFMLSFNQLIEAQAAGDIEALVERDRRVMRIHITHPDPAIILDKLL